MHITYWSTIEAILQFEQEMEADMAAPDPPPDWKDNLITTSPRNLGLGDRVVLPRSYQMARVPPSLREVEPAMTPLADEYLSGPITWLTDMSMFRSGHGIEGWMTVNWTDRGYPTQVCFDFYGIDFMFLAVYRA